MILNEINYKMPIYRDCTLGEILLVGAAVLIISGLTLTILTTLVFGYGFLGMLLAFVSFFHVTKLMLAKLQKVKYGKPYAYFKHLIIKKLIRYGLLKKLFVTKEQKWSVVRIR